MIFKGNNFNKISRRPVSRWRSPRLVFDKSKRGGGRSGSVFHGGKFVYANKTYANPFFRRKKTVIGRSRGFPPPKLIVFGLIIFGLILLWLLFFSTAFKISKIQINGVGDDRAKEIESLVKGLAENRLLGKNNLWLFDKKELSRILNEKYYLESLRVKKRPFHSLIITLKEKQLIAAWLEDDKYFYLDRDGNIINQVDPLNINRLSYPLIENLTGLKIAERKTSASRPEIDYVLSLFDEFKEKRHGFEVERFILDKEAKTVKMAILDGPKIYFNTDEAVAEQAASLDLILKKKLNGDYRGKEYIDLRYGDKIYIKGI